MVFSSYRRTYLPSSYHIVQELQKYNIPDYRPRQEQYVLAYIACHPCSCLTNVLGSRKPSRKFGQRNACAAIVVLLSVRQRMRASRIKPSLSEHTIHQKPVQDPLAIRIRDLTGEDNVFILHDYIIFIMICNASVNLPLLYFLPIDESLARVVARGSLRVISWE